MIAATDIGSKIRTVPSGNCYWAVIRAEDLGIPSFPRLLRARGRRQILYAFEDVLPVPLEGLACGLQRVNSDAVLVAGVPEDWARRARAEGAISLRPDEVPDGLFESAEVDQYRIERPEFLVGQHVPRALHASRTRSLIAATVSVALAAAVVTAGNVEDARNSERQIAFLNARANSVRAEALGVDSSTPSARLSALMTAEVRKQRAAASADGRERLPRNDRALALTLRDWPVGTANLRSLVLTDPALRIEASASERSAADELARRISAIPGWDRPRIDASAQRDGSWSVTLSARRTAEPR